MGIEAEVDWLFGEGVFFAPELESEVLELALGDDGSADYRLVPEDFIECLGFLIIAAPLDFTVLETQFASLL